MEKNWLFRNFKISKNCAIHEILFRRFFRTGAMWRHLSRIQVKVEQVHLLVSSRLSPVDSSFLPLFIQFVAKRNTMFANIATNFLMINCSSSAIRLHFSLSFSLWTQHRRRNVVCYTFSLRSLLIFDSRYAFFRTISTYMRVRARARFTKSGFPSVLKSLKPVCRSARTSEARIL